MDAIQELDTKLAIWRFPPVVKKKRNPMGSKIFFPIGRNVKAMKTFKKLTGL